MITHALGYQSKLLPKAIRETDLYAELKLTEIFRRPSRTGIWYDPQDLTTMYQDAVGTLPVYRPGSGSVDPPVGLLLDKSRGLELGPELIANIADREFSSDTGYWNKSEAVISGGVVSVTAASGVSKGITRAALLSVGKRYRVKLDVVSLSGGTVRVFCGSGGISPDILTTGTYVFDLTALGDSTMRVYSQTAGMSFTLDNISIREIKGYHAAQPTATARPTLSGRYNLLTATATLATQSVTTVATNYTLRFEGTGTITLSGTATGVKSAGTHTITCAAGTLTCTVAGSVTKADLRVKRGGSSLPAYQSVTNANTYDTAGFPLYLKRDLTDDKHTLIVPTGGITGTRLQTTLDTVSTTSETMAAGAFDMFSVPSAGPREITQWLQFGKVLSASELAIAERFSKSRARLV